LTLVKNRRQNQGFLQLDSHETHIFFENHIVDDAIVSTLTCHEKADIAICMALTDLHPEYTPRRHAKALRPQRRAIAAFMLVSVAWGVGTRPDGPRLALSEHVWWPAFPPICF
jgi:hypothetical protein